jgi:hypothetical protein
VANRVSSTPFGTGAAATSSLRLALPPMWAARDIATLLLDHGARLDIFAAAMLGKLDIVKAAITAFPAAKSAPGPHGIPLIVHAQAGGEEARPVLDYLQSLR